MSHRAHIRSSRREAFWPAFEVVALRYEVGPSPHIAGQHPQLHGAMRWRGHAIADLVHAVYSLGDCWEPNAAGLDHRATGLPFVARGRVEIRRDAELPLGGRRTATHGWKRWRHVFRGVSLLVSRIP
jgi:hypothetical protein